MEELNKSFNVPYYLFKEIIDYIEQTAKGHCKSMKWKNINSLIDLAVINKRITKEQANHLKTTFCRE